ncbi:uncharacterized protein LOC124706534 [Lolium rigidum]|uniref:uncharacterized protein LOC124706534 n=1 Tax=Lolium rigidum TaxID=89674 RepID=UPI001F5E2721|nr:uncharacterized protein LOC124706534 [Lolium rigidum]
MSALLRQGARRICGAVLQRTRAAVTSPAVAEERRRIVASRMYSTEEQGHVELVREIQKRKDELYDLIVKGDRNCKTSSWWDAFFLTHLCKDVTPRPSDSVWRDLKSSTSVISRIKRAGFFSLGFLAVDYYNASLNDEKVAPGMIMKEEHAASEVEE